MAAPKRKRAKPRKRKAKDPRTEAERTQAAKDLLDEVKEHERGPSSGNRLEQVQRDTEIFRAAMRGLQPETLAPAYGLQASTVREIIKRMGKEARRISDQDPAEILQEHIWMLDAAIDELAAIAAKEKGSARVAAIRARLDAMRDKVQTLQSVGYLPYDLGMLGVRIEVKALYEAIWSVLITEKVPRNVIRKIAYALEPGGVTEEDIPPELEKAK